jgi:predicted nucleotidyltransferase
MVNVLDARPSVILRAHRDEVLAIAARFGISEVRVFGSVARGDDGPDSDIDLMVSFEPGSMSMGDLVAFEDALTELLGVPVDVVSSAARRIQSVERHAIAL